MGRATDFVIAAVLIMVSVVVHLISVELFAPDNALYAIGTDGTEVLNGPERVAIWSEFFIFWMPLSVVLTAFAWVTLREFRRQVQTGTGQARRPG